MYFRLPIIILFIVVCLGGFVVYQGSVETTSVANGHPLENNVAINETNGESKSVDLVQDVAAINSITARDLHAHVDFLADDLLEGRDANSHGGRVAARYIASHFERCGLQEFGESNSYYQPVPLNERTVLPSTEFSVEVDGEMIPLKYGEDFLVTDLPNESGEKISAELVFTAFGITAEEYNYDDYSKISTKNKLSVYVTGEPHSENDSLFFKGKQDSRYTRRSAKLKAAKSAGALGLIAISTSKYLEKYNWNRIKKYFGKPDISLAKPDEELESKLPLIALQPKASELILAGSGKDFAMIDAKADSGSLAPLRLHKKAEITVRFESHNFIDNNVVAYLEGSDSKLKDEVIVIGGHYDHIGIGTVVDGDSIYNGAADNASGVSSILELAEAFSLLPEPPRRSILFIAYAAEEKGLLGSEYYVNNPLFPLSKTVANFNIDMIGIGDSTAIMLIGQELSSLGKVLAEAGEQVGLTVQPDRMPGQRLFYRSDQYSFAKKGIPAIFPSFYMDPSDLQELYKYYHKPQDDITWDWFNFNTMEKQIKAVFLAVLSVANADNVPEWETGVEFSQYRKK